MRRRRRFTPIALTIVAAFALISWFETMAFVLLLGYILLSLALDLWRTSKAQWQKKPA